jgi:hypothetical protein
MGEQSTQYLTNDIDEPAQEFAAVACFGQPAL